MTGKNYDKFMNTLRENLNKMWQNKPSDLENLEKRTGHMNFHASPVIEAEHEASMLCNELWALREVQKKEESDLETLKEVTKVLLGLSARRYNSYYKMPLTNQLLEDAIKACDEIRTREEFRQFIEQLLLYAGRLDWWTHLLIPWYDISVTFEKARKKRISAVTR
jgi:hypothetical protein